MFVGMNEFNPHIGIVFETDIIGDLEEKVVTTSGLESERHFSQTDFEVIFFRKTDTRSNPYLSINPPKAVL